MAEYDPEIVGARIVRLREARGLMQKALAAQMGITPQNLSNYESGRDLIPVHKAAQLCVITGATFDYLYRGLVGTLPADLAAKVSGSADARQKRRATRA